MSIAQQIAMPTRPAKARRPAAPLRPVAVPSRASTLARIFGLMTITALGAALIVGSVAIGVMVFVSNMLS